MEIPAAGVRYAKWGTDTTGALEVSFDRGATWHDLTSGTEDADGIWTAGVGTVHAILVAGPDAPTTNSPLVLTVGVHPTRVRYTGTPEVFIESTGPLTVR